LSTLFLNHKIRDNITFLTKGGNYMKYKTLIARAERLREEGSPLQAAILLEGVEHAANKAKKYRTQGDALAQRIVCYEHLARTRKPAKYLRLMETLCQEGIELAQTHRAARSYLRIFLYRLGDAKFRQEAYTEAVYLLEEAIKGLPEKDDKYPEFASYLGLALVFNGDSSGTGNQLLDKALGRIQAAKSNYAELDRWMIHYTGVLLRIARAEIHLKRKTIAANALFQADAWVNLLATKYKKPRRLEEYRKIYRLLNPHRR
jgi:hypothetical protein